MARRGAASLLIETMWSDRDWFIKRTQDDDYSDSIRQVIELRQAMEVLLAQPGVDPVPRTTGKGIGLLQGSRRAETDQVV